MKLHSVTAVLFGVVLAFLSSTAYLISCPPNDLLETPPSLRHLCYAIERVVSDNVVEEPTYRRLEQRDVTNLAQRNMNPETKRQDLDHVFLRFGRLGV